MKSYLDRTGQTLIAIGLLLLLYTASVRVYGEAYQAYQQRAFDQSLEGLESGGTSSPNGASQSSPNSGSVIGRLEIPSVGLSVMVLEGVGESELRLGAGHVPGTAPPGEPGNVSIAAHRDTFFRPLRNIQEGEIITLTTLQGVFRYRVESTWTTRPDDTTVLQRDSESVLTLITCYPFSFVGAAPERFIVRARRLQQLDS